MRNDQYAIALALIVDGKVKLGVLGCPNLASDHSDADSEIGCLFFATESGGAHTLALSQIDIDGPADPLLSTATKISMKQKSSISDAAFCESVESAHTKHSASAEIANLLKVTAAPVRMDSQCKYAALARGEADVYLRLLTRPGYVERIWDHAAGWIITKESGACITDIHGNEPDFSHGRGLEENKGVVASLPEFNDALIKAINEVL